MLASFSRNVLACALVLCCALPVTSLAAQHNSSPAKTLNVLACALVRCSALPVTRAARHKSSPAKTLDVLSVNGAEWQDRLSAPVLLKPQILLDRAHVSPGEIDANLGEKRAKRSQPSEN